MLLLLWLMLLLPLPWPLLLLMQLQQLKHFDSLDVQVWARHQGNLI